MDEQMKGFIEGMLTTVNNSKERGIDKAVWTEILIMDIHNAQDSLSELGKVVDPNRREATWVVRCGEQLSLALEYVMQIQNDPRGQQVYQGDRRVK